MQLFNELVELLEAIEKGGDLPPMGPAHQELLEVDEDSDGGTSHARL
jgi:hypothetical protein